MYKYERGEVECKDIRKIKSMKISEVLEKSAETRKPEELEKPKEPEKPEEPVKAEEKNNEIRNISFLLK